MLRLSTMGVASVHIRTAFVLRDVLELSVDDASKVLETSSAEVRKRTHRARLMLRGLFDQMG